jgi:hypothetical protein
MNHRPNRSLSRFILGFLALAASCAAGAFDWQSGPWGIVIGTNGTPGSAACSMDYPGGTKTGNALAVHYQLEPLHSPQLWVFLTDGFWRQASPESSFLTSYRLFRYHSSGDVDCDRLAGSQFRVLGTNSAGELEIALVYSNNAASGDRFHVAGRVRLEKPSPLQSAMGAELTVSNASGRAVSPAWQGHRLFAEQWVLFGISSMHVADTLSGGLPSWYDGLDPLHRYVGVTNDAGFLNDAYSVNGKILVSPHDAKYIRAGESVVALNHDTGSCPVVVVPGYEWYAELVMLGQSASDVLVQHAHRSARNHRVRVEGCSGLVSDAAALKWAATYNRSDANMVDGDNVQVKLGMDEVVDTWPAAGVQGLALRLVTGNDRPAITSFSVSPGGTASLGWTIEPGEAYNLQGVALLGGSWSNTAAGLTGPSVQFQAGAPGFFRVVETNVP